MRLKEFIKKIQKITDEHPEALDYDVIHFSCGGITAYLVTRFSPKIGEYKKFPDTYSFMKLENKFNSKCYSNKFNAINI